MPGLAEEGAPCWPGHSHRKGREMWGVFGGIAFAGFLALMFGRSSRRTRRDG
jgi:hypothetical protein